MKRLTTEEFISRSNNTHDNFYDYSKSNYVNSKEKVIIICQFHGEFLQAPIKHMSGQGCKKCGQEKSIKKLTSIEARKKANKTRTHTQEEFLEIANKTHYNFYDYSKAIYTKGINKITIVCPIHGEFNQEANAHMRGSGCKQCSFEKTSKRKTLSTEEFVDRSNKMHDNFYDYSKVSYYGNNKKVVIICPIHGEFLQTPQCHMAGQGCRKCGIAKFSASNRLTTEEFIERSNNIHNCFYDYSKSIYTRSKDNIIIICPKHGEFQQSAGGHLSGKGCKKCGSIRSLKVVNSKEHQERSSKSRRLTTEEFVRRSKEIHGDKYDYSGSNYKTMHTNVSIFCNYCQKEFSQMPASHLSGSGCRDCSYRLRGLKGRLGKEEFVKRAKEIHGDRFDYSLVKYKNMKSNVNIICPDHGKFEQTPETHLAGSSCTRCSSSLGEIQIAMWLENRGIEFEREKTFESCRMKRLLKFDFFLPNKNILIEYQGVQHFKPIEYFGGEERFKELVACDLRKVHWADRSPYYLHVIDYTDDVNNSLLNFIGE